jgi:hypothetical protein
LQPFVLHGFNTLQRHTVSLRPYKNCHAVHFSHTGKHTYMHVETHILILIFLSNPLKKISCFFRKFGGGGENFFLPPTYSNGGNLVQPSGFKSGGELSNQWTYHCTMSLFIRKLVVDSLNITCTNFAMAPAANIKSMCCIVQSSHYAILPCTHQPPCNGPGVGSTFHDSRTICFRSSVHIPAVS